LGGTVHTIVCMHVQVQTWKHTCVNTHIHIHTDTHVQANHKRAGKYLKCSVQ